jgi:hopanoid-associated phosphorylase
VTPPHLGVLVGLQSEARCLPAIPSLSVALSGARRDGAEAAAAQLIAGGATRLLSFGLAGGLDPALLPGALLLPDRLSSADGGEYRIDGDWHALLAAAMQDLRPAVGRHLGVDTPVAGTAEKAALFTGQGALAVDMESHILARAAAGRPFAVLRVVCDGAHEILPPAALVGVRPDGSTDLPRILASLLRRPGQLPALIRLGRVAALATKVLIACGRRLAATSAAR